MAYIYKIENDINGKVYIGKTYSSIEKRFKEHLKDSKKEKISNRPLYKAIRKYGESHFHISLIEETGNPEEREKYWIESYGSFKNGYNATLGGDGKSYIDRELVLKTYSTEKSIVKTAELCGCCKDTVSSILHDNGITREEIRKNSDLLLTKPVVMINKDTNEKIKVFPSLRAAEKYLEKPPSGHIASVCKGKRKTAHGYKWAYL